MTSNHFAPMAFGHISLTVRDIEKSIEFYRDTVGLELLWDITYTAEQITAMGSYDSYHQNFRSEHDVTRVVLFRLPGGPGIGGPSILGLQAHPGDTLHGEALQMDDVGITHFSLMVPDKAEFDKRMLEKGARQADVNHFLDPDGILVQVEDPEFQRQYNARYTAAHQAQWATQS
jgi:catechol 2,3-dioxygenase-like lactoylglutathione lyase family enzyme